jgi:transcriptional regulator with XRE-family HTH domain
VDIGPTKERFHLLSEGILDCKAREQRIAKNVRRQRRARGWTQQALADRVRTSRIYVAQIEGASKEISLAMLGRLAEALRVKPGRLLD